VLPADHGISIHAFSARVALYSVLRPVQIAFRVVSGDTEYGSERSPVCVNQIRSHIVHLNGEDILYMTTLKTLSLDGKSIRVTTFSLVVVRVPCHSPTKQQ
jgi:hypothetical protein